MGIIRLGPPVDLLSELAAKFHIRNFVETGTFRGKTAKWASEHFNRVFTIELSRQLYHQTTAKYGTVPNIEFIFGHTGTELANVIKRLEGSAVFWLDAHWSGSVTFGSDDQCPLLSEIATVNHFAGASFVFIDDARLFLSPPQPPHDIDQWPTVLQILDALRAGNPDRYIVIIEDVIIAVPLFAKEAVARYCQKTNAMAWGEYQATKNRNAKGSPLAYYIQGIAGMKRLLRLLFKM